MDDKREVPQRQAEAYYKLLDNPCVHHAGCLISHSIVNEQCKDVAKTGFLNCQLIQQPFFGGIFSLTHAAPLPLPYFAGQPVGVTREDPSLASHPYTQPTITYAIPNTTKP